MSANYDSLCGNLETEDIQAREILSGYSMKMGEYRVKLLSFGSEGRISKSEVNIKVYPLPVARFEVSRGDPVLPDEEVMFYNYSEDSIDWKWNFGDGLQAVILNLHISITVMDHIVLSLSQSQLSVAGIVLL